jgi:hypothetical protein
MNWKEFLRPTKFKLGLFGLIFFIFFLASSALTYYNWEGSTNFVLFFIHRFFTTIIMLFSWLLVTTIFESRIYDFFLQAYLEPNIFEPIVILIPLAIYLYIISCFVKWVLDRKDKRLTKNVLIIFGLIVLVAELIVFIFVPYTPERPYTPPVVVINQTLIYRQFKAKCDSFCQNFMASGSNVDAAKFCAEKLTGDTDLNRNGGDDAFQTSSGMPYVCEDSLYCFHVTSCVGDNRKIDWSDCKNILCNYYSAIYKNSNLAEYKVYQLFPHEIGACRLPDNASNWYQLYFANKPCPSVAGITSTSIYPGSSGAVISCVQLNSTSINCRWACPNIVSSQNPGILSNDATFQIVQLTQSSGNYIFTDLTKGRIYNIGLVCDVPQSQIVTSYSIKIF